MAKESIEHALEDFEHGAEARVEIRFRSRAGIRPALGLLARCALEVLVAAREADGTHAPAQVQAREARRCESCGAPEDEHPYRHPFKSREHKGSRWQG